MGPPAPPRRPLLPLVTSWGPCFPLEALFGAGQEAGLGLNAALCALSAELSRRGDALPPCLCFFAGQEGILRCHPDLAGRELQRGTLTAESQREQSSAGLTSLSADERLRLAELNAQYRARFGFPFVLAARLSDRAAVPRELARRLHCPPAQELRTALAEVKKIGHLRLADLLGVDPAGPQRPREPGAPDARRDARGPQPGAVRPGLEAVASLERRPHTRVKEGEN